MKRGCAIALIALLGCRDRRPAAEPVPAVVADASTCASLPYAMTIEVPEASGAVWLADRARLLIISDSGHDGTYVEVDAAGAIVGHGQLPLGAGGDDVEGLALDGDRIWGVASSGWMRAWRRAADGYQLEVAYALDDTCQARSVNCGANYEGLCLSPRPLADGCDGYAASKQTGALVCVRRAGDRFTLDAARHYPITSSGRLADCAIAADGTVWTGDNGFGLGEVRQWAITADGATLLGRARLGVGFPEVLAFGPELSGGFVDKPSPIGSGPDGSPSRYDRVIYRLSDLGGAPSLATAFRCPAGLPKAGPADADG